MWRHISPTQHHQTDLILWLYVMYVDPWLPIWISLTYFKSYWQSRPLFGIFSWQYEIVNTSTDYEASCNETQPEEDLEKELCQIWDGSYWKIVKGFLKPLSIFTKNSILNVTGYLHPSLTKMNILLISETAVPLMVNIQSNTGKLVTSHQSARDC